MQLGGKDQEYSFRLIKFKMPIRHPSGDIEQEIGYMTLEFREAQA